MCALFEPLREKSDPILPHLPVTTIVNSFVGADILFTTLFIVTDFIYSYLHYGSKFIIIIIVICKYPHKATLNHSSWVENTSFFEDSSVPALLALNKEGLLLEEQETKIRWGEEGIT